MLGIYVAINTLYCVFNTISIDIYFGLNTQPCWSVISPYISMFISKVKSQRIQLFRPATTFIRRSQASRGDLNGALFSVDAREKRLS